MPAKTFTLLDDTYPLHLDRAFRPQDMGDEGKWLVEVSTLKNGLSEGVQRVRVYNGKISFDVLPTRGMGIWQATANKTETIGWQSPVRGPVHPKFVDLGEPSGLGWLDGFDELFCRCGLAEKFRISSRTVKELELNFVVMVEVIRSLVKWKRVSSTIPLSEISCFSLSTVSCTS